MDIEQNNRLIDDWITNQKTFWAWEKLHQITDRSHDEAWLLVIEIAKRSDSEDVLGALAAGPMEDMLTAFGDYYYELILQASSRCKNFKKALLMGIRITGEGSEKVKELIASIAKEAVREGWHPSL
ncbi:DUF6869 domain-containing protein [Teredinibacter franksiae]|uniref:DUF6869 domain-containing protein n=1 Tax=Teredinibacter franksiae TaxID=2761453 RepID=UPI001624F8A6|nr:hypothetical protein [Teredinibacter franksiae]